MINLMRESRLELALSSLKAGVYSFDLKSQTAWYSPGFFEILGYSESELQNDLHNLFEVILHPDDAPSFLSKLEQSCRGSIRFSADARLKSANGKYRWFECTGRRQESEEEDIFAGCIIDINEKKQLQEVLSTREFLLSEAGRIGRVGGWDFDVETSKAYWSKTVYDVFGVRYDYDTDKRGSFVLIMEEYRPALEKAINDAIQFGVPWDLEMQLIESSKWVRSVGKPVIDGSGKIKQLRGVFMDINDYKTHEQALEVSLEVLKAKNLELNQVLDNSLDIICTINNLGEFSSMNGAAVKILGFELDELIGHPYIGFVHPDDVQATNERAQEILEKKFLYNFENRCLRKDKTYINLEWCVAWSDEKQTLFCIARDITQQKAQAEATLRLQTAIAEQAGQLNEKDRTIEKIREFEFMTNSIPQIIWTATPDGNLDYYNQHWFDYTGLTLEQTLGWGWAPVIHPADLQRCIDVWTECYTTGKHYEIEYRFKRASDGVYKWHLGRALPLRNEKGEIVKWFGSCTDIDEYKRALDLEHEITQYEDFNRIVAHNLRGPAGSIEMLTGMLAANENPGEHDNLIQMLQKSSLALNSTLAELMKVLEVRTNKHLPFEDCPFEGIMASVLPMLQGQILSSHAVVKTQFDVPLVKYPKIYLESIFYNLLSNALKYCKAGVPPDILVSSRQVNGTVMLGFKDNGLGIDLNKHGNNVFKLNKIFHRGFESKGVGLFMTKTQIETFGGKISVSSTPNVGSEFTVTFK